RPRSAASALARAALSASVAWLPVGSMIVRVSESDVRIQIRLGLNPYRCAISACIAHASSDAPQAASRSTHSPDITIRALGTLASLRFLVRPGRLLHTRMPTPGGP